MKIEDNPLRIVFNDSEDEKKYIRFIENLSKYLKQHKKQNFVMSFDLLENKVSNEQIKLWNVLLSLIAKESGNDFYTTKETIQNECNVLNVEELSKEDFSILIEKTILFVNEFFELNIIYNEKTEKFEIKKGLC